MHERDGDPRGTALAPRADQDDAARPVQLRFVAGPLTGGDRGYRFSHRHPRHGMAATYGDRNGHEQ
jgi:hypothetical protein